jgi:predicted CXXCH cytochrome family protein
MTRRNHRIAIALSFALGFSLFATSVAFASTESTYAVWDPAPPNDAPATPHSGYTTSTTKCAVCHAVHKAPADGELLLRSTVGEACVYCHIDTDLGVVTIYNGDRTAYLSENKNNHSLEGGAPCSGCHSVHGANTYTGAIATKILKALPIQPEFVRLFTDATNTPEPFYTGAFPYVNGGGEPIASPPNKGDDGWYGARFVQQVAFCTGCHPYYTDASEHYITTDRMIVEGAISTQTRTFASHPMKFAWEYDADGNPVDSSFEATGSTLPAGSKVALMSTNGCFRCHGERDYLDLGPGDPERSFPHYTPNRQRFLVSSDENGGQQRLDTLDSTQDGTCFPCHRWDDGSSGTGVTY